MMRNAEEQMRKQKQLLKEGYMEMAKESANINKEWVSADKNWD